MCGGSLATVYPNGGQLKASDSTGCGTTGVSMSWTYCPTCSPIAPSTYEKIMGPWKSPSELEFTDWKAEPLELTGWKTSLNYDCREKDGLVQIFLDTPGKGLSVAELSAEDAKKLARKLKKLARSLQGCK